MSKKYRPYLSLSMMQRISSLASSDSELDTSIRKAMEVMIIKATHGITQPSFTPLVDKLGMDDLEESSDDMRFKRGEMSPEEEADYQASLMDKLFKEIPTLKMEGEL